MPGQVLVRMVKKKTIRATHHKNHASEIGWVCILVHTHTPFHAFWLAGNQRLLLKNSVLLEERNLLQKVA